MSAPLWNTVIERMLVRIQDTARRVREGFPHWANPETGEWVTTPDGDWTGGYWLGMLWLAHRATGEARYRGWAEPLLERLRSRIEGETVFKAFPFYYGASLASILSGHATARELASGCATSLAKLYDPKLRLIPLGRQAEEGSHVGTGETSIDSLGAAPFLLWAAAEIGDRTLREVGRSHADRVIALHLRADGSFIQSSSLDPRSGEVVKHYTHKGYSEKSTWGRAQAWGVLFSTMSYIREPGEAGWLSAAMRGADWWIEHVPEDRVAFWDFDDPAIPNTERDTAATTIAAAALLKLGATAPSESERARCRGCAESTVEALVSRYLTPTSPDDRRIPGILTESCFNKRPDARPQDAASRCEFIVADYYLFESLLALAGKLDPARI
jgi:unsaturated chondroitin disaccharide hydrolase